eukprot:TRINITY_DN1229_c0_g1_i1.p1 TRINITY_DN1229_c0_g1~~TRINITY_DN1229_c0_g1_i1.p1  ORF type:complete len:761 (-),score=246.51 TRINITY_DN1229_c0_g1_i1:1651-3933(-)
MQRDRAGVPLFWELYFQTEPYEEISNTAPVDAFIDTILAYGDEPPPAVVAATGELDWRLLSSIDVMRVEWDKLRAHLTHLDALNAFLLFPSTAVLCFGIAAHQKRFDLLSQHVPKEDLDESLPVSFGELDPIRVRIIGFEPLVGIRSIKTNSINQFIAVRGTVIRTGNISPLMVSMNFVCAKCEAAYTQFFQDGKYTVPTRCFTRNCRSRAFDPVYSSAKSRDSQTLKIQELMSDSLMDAGRVPRAIECELTDDMVDFCRPGDVVVVCGIVRSVSTEVQKKSKGMDARAMYSLHVEANSLSSDRQWTSMNASSSGRPDLQLIRAIIDEGPQRIFPLVANSICPSIYGHELVKAGIALTLFGGVRRFAEDTNRVAIRGDPHLFIVGDPGLGKSQMLTAAAQIAPRGVYVCGGYTTSAGLTVTLHKEQGSNDFSIEAGALVLGDKGICCIDEFDKMSQEHSALLEAMEQQNISIAKAGIICTLPCRTSVIAAANPVGGHYDRSKTVAENLKVAPAVLSRFDLIFILLDKPDEELDELLSDHVMAIHTNGGRSRGTSSRMRSARLESEYAEDSLENRLRVNPHDFDHLPSHCLRKYIAYAREYCHPELSDGAIEILKEFYLSLREKHKSVDSTPITTRQLESLIRLSEARARMELRQIVTAEDARDVVEIMKASLYQTVEDQFGNIDFRRTTGMSVGNAMRKMYSILLRRVSSDGYEFTVEDMRKIKDEHNIVVTGSFLDFIDKMNNNNYLLKKGGGRYKVVT